MSNPRSTERRMLGVKVGYQRPAWSYAPGNPQPSQEHKARQSAAQGRASRPQSGERKPRQWSGGFEATALLVVGEQTRPEATLSRRCKHVRADGSTVGDVVARFHYKAPPPATGTLVQVGALVEASNGAASGAPLFRLTVIRWHEVTGAHAET
ncbi:hypothetical protein ACPPTR_10565 [Ralstonia pseudosolanacearum]|uniref:hypothetical protein n=1 Tax=Ralstonia pseudosolanacearum TaxID=1310165 RepID=UPI0018D04586|nr:hypothetical protein [Ralstonia pseudosolanacearum]